MPDRGTMPFALVSDFDGTITKNDFFLLAIQQLAPPDLPDYWSAYLKKEITHFEALAGIFSHLVGDEEKILAVARQCILDPKLRESVDKLEKGGWHIIVASAGCRWYIERLLIEADVDLELHANPGRYVPGAGLEMRFPTDSPFVSKNYGIDKPAIVRSALGRFDRVAFAGDGFPDAVAAKLVPADLRFARGNLAEALDKEGLPYRPFEVWSDIAKMLLEMPEVETTA